MVCTAGSTKDKKNVYALEPLCSRLEDSLFECLRAKITAGLKVYTLRAKASRSEILVFRLDKILVEEKEHMVVLTQFLATRGWESQIKRLCAGNTFTSLASRGQSVGAPKRKYINPLVRFNFAGGANSCKTYVAQFVPGYLIYKNFVRISSSTQIRCPYYRIQSQTSRVKWKLRPATKGCSFLPCISDKEGASHVNVEMRVMLGRANKARLGFKGLGLLRRVPQFLGKILR